MKQASCSTLDKMEAPGSINKRNMKILLISLAVALIATSAFALTVPVAGGLGYAVYTIMFGIYNTGIGYVIAGCMFLWGCIHLPKDWKESLLWMAGGIGVGSLVTLIGASGLIL